MSRTTAALSLYICTLVAFFFFPIPLFAQTTPLTPEESLWLSARNSTIVVYPERNNPPFSYQTPSGIIQGLSIDYIELIAEKIDAQIEYLTPRSHAQILSDVKDGRGDVLLSLVATEDREKEFRFTDSYVTVSVVMVARKDADIRTDVTLSDFTGKRVALIDGSAVEEFVRKNYPRVVIETVTDDEIALQQVVLGEVDLSLIDAASLSYLLSKQVLTSVKVVGSVGLDYLLSFAVPKEKEQLQSILEKGLSQISTREREVLAEKWVALSDVSPKQHPLFGIETYGTVIALTLAAAVVVLLFILIRHRRFDYYSFASFRKKRRIDELKTEINELETTSGALVKELEEVKALEEDIHQKLKQLEE